MRTNIKRLSLGAAVLGLALGGTSLTLINQAQASTGGQAAEQTQTSNSINLSQSDAINKFNEIFNAELERKLKLNKNIEQVIDYIMWKFSIKSGKFDYDFVPEWIEFIITDLIDLESNDVKKSIKKAINKHYIKEKNHYYRKSQYAK